MTGKIAKIAIIVFLILVFLSGIGLFFFFQSRYLIIKPGDHLAQVNIGPVIETPYVTVIPEPTDEPLIKETPEPTATTTASPTLTPTSAPTLTHTVIPTLTPTLIPTLIPTPTSIPTPIPGSSPGPTSTPEPTFTPSFTPTPTFTPSPTFTPTPTFTPLPTSTPTPSSTPTPFPTPLPTATAYPVFHPEEHQEVGKTYEKWGDWDVVTTRYEDGTEECIISADDGIEPSSCVTYPDGTMIESGGGQSYITVIYPDDSLKIICDNGITEYWSPEGKYLYCVERIEHARFGLVFYLRYHHDNDFTAVICNSDGSPNRFSGQTYQRGSLSFGGWGRCFNLFDEDGVHHHIPVDDGPFYDY